ncbi:unnamed protein product, partial [Sphacelaria rigidula]
MHRGGGHAMDGDMGYRSDGRRHSGGGMGMMGSGGMTDNRMMRGGGGGHHSRDHLDGGSMHGGEMRMDPRGGMDQRIRGSMGDMGGIRDQRGLPMGAGMRTGGGDHRDGRGRPDLRHGRDVGMMNDRGAPRGGAYLDTRGGMRERERGVVPGRPGGM